MKEIEDRGKTYKSWRSYAKALEKELACLQQFLSSERVQRCHDSIKEGKDQ